MTTVRNIRKKNPPPGSWYNAAKYMQHCLCHSICPGLFVVEIQWEGRSRALIYPTLISHNKRARIYLSICISCVGWLQKTCILPQRQAKCMLCRMYVILTGRWQIQFSAPPAAVLNIFLVENATAGVWNMQSNLPIDLAMVAVLPAVCRTEMGTGL